MSGPPDADERGPLGRLAVRLDAVDRRVFPVVFYGFLLVWMVALLVVSWEWAWRDKLVAYLAGLATIALIGVVMVKVVSPATYDRLTFFLPEASEIEADDEASELLATYQELRESGDMGRPRSQQIYYGIRMTAWAMALPTTAFAYGLFVFAFGVRFYETLLESVVVTVVFSILMYIFFWEIIGMSPWTGTLDLPSIVEVLGLG